jgi:hypothetical protein
MEQKHTTILPSALEPLDTASSELVHKSMQSDEIRLPLSHREEHCTNIPSETRQTGALAATLATHPPTSSPQPIAPNSPTSKPGLPMT